ncbi:hypothetical protein [Actinomadura napierensis]|uniref:Uncharacterized protein n=1 Tax=Actinomadura napierensis TaxID=267854 RepID=A0ABN2YJU5_9ACTN
MRVEDYVDGDDHAVRAELPGIDPDKDGEGIGPALRSDALAASGAERRRER